MCSDLGAFSHCCALYSATGIVFMVSSALFVSISSQSLGPHLAVYSCFCREVSCRYNRIRERDVRGSVKVSAEQTGFSWCTSFDHFHDDWAHHLWFVPKRRTVIITMGTNNWIYYYQKLLLGLRYITLQITVSLTWFFCNPIFYSLGLESCW